MQHSITVYYAAYIVSFVMCRCIWCVLGGKKKSVALFI